MSSDFKIMAGKTCLVTGATSGIGAETAAALAALGARVILVGRNAEKGRERLAQIRRESGNDQLDFLQANLASLESINRLADLFYQAYASLDVLVNNAGGIFMRRQFSPDKIEMTFALNHLNYFLLTHLLLDALKAVPRARIVNVSSAAHTHARIAFDNLQGERGYSGWGAYAQSKLANLLFTYELARRLNKTGITANALHPGFVATRFGLNNPGLPGMAHPPFPVRRDQSCRRSQDQHLSGLRATGRRADRQILRQAKTRAVLPTIVRRNHCRAPVGGQRRDDTDRGPGLMTSYRAVQLPSQFTGGLLEIGQLLALLIDHRCRGLLGKGAGEQGFQAGNLRFGFRQLFFQASPSRTACQQGFQGAGIPQPRRLPGRSGLPAFGRSFRQP